MTSDTDLEQELQAWATHARKVTPPPIPARAAWQSNPSQGRRFLVLAAALTTVAAVILVGIYAGNNSNDHRGVQSISGAQPRPSATPSQPTAIPTAISSTAALGIGTDPTGGCPNPVDQAKRSATSPTAWTLRSAAPSGFQVRLPLRNFPGVTLDHVRAFLTTGAGAVQPVSYVTDGPSTILVNGHPLTVTIRAVDQKGHGLRPGTYTVHLAFQDDCGGKGGPVTADIPEGELTVTP